MIAIITLASAQSAKPVPLLRETLRISQKSHHIPVKLVAKDNLMRITLRGLLKR